MSVCKICGIVHFNGQLCTTSNNNRYSNVYGCCTKTTKTSTRGATGPQGPQGEQGEPGISLTGNTPPLFEEYSYDQNGATGAYVINPPADAKYMDILLIGGGGGGGDINLVVDSETLEQIGQTLVPDEGDGTYRYGYNVNINSAGDIVAVRKYIPVEGNTSLFEPVVEVYQYASNTWFRLGQDIPVGLNKRWGVVDDVHFGLGMDGSGHRIVVAEQNNDEVNPIEINVNVYNWNGVNWSQFGNTLASTQKDSMRVEINALGDHVIVSDYGGLTIGDVKVYRYNGSTWSQVGNTIQGDQADYDIGASLSINSDGSIIAVGIPTNNNNSFINSPNIVRVYEYNSNNNTWDQLGPDFVGSAENGRYGISVSLNSSGDTIAIGAGSATDLSIPSSIGNGLAQVFKWNSISEIWNQVGGDILTDGTGTRRLGNGLITSVSINSAGDKLVMGYKDYDPNGTSTSNDNYGEVKLYNLVNGAWVQVLNSIYGGISTIDGTRGDKLGFSVKINDNGDRFIVGTNPNYGQYAKVYEHLVEYADPLGGIGGSAGAELDARIYLEDGDTYAISVGSGGLGSEDGNPTSLLINGSPIYTASGGTKGSDSSNYDNNGGNGISGGYNGYGAGGGGASDTGFVPGLKGSNKAEDGNVSGPGGKGADGGVVIKYL